MSSPDEIDPALAREIEVYEEEERLKKLGQSSKPAAKTAFCRVNQNENLTTVLIVLIGALIVPLVWAQLSGLVFSLLLVLSKILLASSALVLTILSWGLLLYPVAGLIILVYLSGWLNQFSNADRIDFSDDGLILRFPSRKKILLDWQDISSVYLFRPNYTMLPERWLVGFGSPAARPISLKMPAASLQSERLLNALKDKCKWISIDPDLIELWEPATADSRMELWLKTLTNAPRESELMPLFPGADLAGGRYRILARIAAGGQGTAYLASDNENEQEVVVKENLFPVFVEPQVREDAEARFKHEVEILSGLRHENIVALLDSFIEGHRGYLVLEYVQGLSLRKLVQLKGAIPESEVVNLAVQMAKVLAYLHELSPPVVHRDFTPDNLLLQENGRLVLIDFNVARQSENTKTATVVGKHAYIPPEQFRGQTDKRSDIYAMGATIYYLLCAEDPEAISQSFPSKKLPALNPLIDKLVADASCQSLEGRIASAAEVLRRLAEYDRAQLGI